MISSLVKKTLSKNGIPLQKMVFFSTDQAASLSGSQNGAIAHLKHAIPHLSNLLCNCHCINSSIGAGMRYGPIGESLKLANHIVNFFGSAKRKHYLDSVQRILTDGSQKLKSFCATRWSEQHKAVSSVIENLPTLTKTLEILCDTDDPALKKDSNQMLVEIRTPDAIFPLFLARKALAILKPIVIALQANSLDIITAQERIRLARMNLVLSKSSDAQFRKLYEEFIRCSDTIKCFLNRSQILYPEHKINLKREIYQQFFQLIIDDIDARKSTNEEAVELLVKILRKKNLSDQDIDKLLKKYGNVLDLENDNSTKELFRAEKMAFDNEFEKYAESEQVDIIFLLKNSAHYTILNLFLSLLATAAVSNAEAERTFSALKRIKTPLKSTMLESRLNSISMICLNMDLVPETELVFNDFVSSATRKPDL